MNKKILNKVAQTIYDKKGFNIIAIDVKESSFLCDYVIIAEGNIDRHVIAIADAIVEELKKLDIKPFYIEGDRSGEWVVIDYLDLIVHIMIPEFRERYRLERLYEKGKIVDVTIHKDSLMAKEG